MFNIIYFISLLFIFSCLNNIYKLIYFSKVTIILCSYITQTYIYIHICLNRNRNIEYILKYFIKYGVALCMFIYNVSQDISK